MSTTSDPHEGSLLAAIVAVGSVLFVGVVCGCCVLCAGLPLIENRGGVGDPWIGLSYYGEKKTIADGSI